MSFRGTPFEDLEIKVDPVMLTVHMTCDSCGAGSNRFTVYNISDPDAFRNMWKEYVEHVTESHNLSYPSPYEADDRNSSAEQILRVARQALSDIVARSEDYRSQALAEHWIEELNKLEAK